MSEAQVIKALNEAGKPLKAGEIAEITGLDKKEIDKIIKKLRTEEVIHSPKRCFYEPK
ncbi:MAG: ArsR family transcriptional regulator [Syntrophomonadaceae bacterium]|nr:ArsR family transcriptional regulator [Syntrophomonadaceae bacterium]